MNHIVFKKTIIGYNRHMPNSFAKKSKQILINVDPQMAEIIAGIAQDQDRPAGYVARELMIRGLSLFLADGRLRDDKSSKNERSPNGKSLATQSKTKIPIKKEQPAHRKKMA